MKRYNNNPQVMVGKQRNGLPSTEIYFSNDFLALGFESKKAARKCTENIISLVLGEEVEIDYLGEDAPNSMDVFKEFSEDFGNIGDAFKSAFVINSKNNKNKKSVSSKSSTKCIGCGARVTGKTNSVVRCQYCDTNNQL